MHTPYKVNYNGTSTAYDIEMNIGKLKCCLWALLEQILLKNWEKYTSNQVPNKIVLVALECTVLS